MCPATSSNPIKSVRQSAKRMRPPDVLTPKEITALLEKLPEPLRTARELDAFTGLRRGELIGLQWQDVDFENLVIHFRRSVVMMVAGAPKTEASAKDVPLDAALAESLLKLKLTGPYDRETDWVFVSVTMKVVQELLRHANSRITLDLYAQAGMPEKRQAQSRLVERVLRKGKSAV
jgi:integrase